jgi:hypothetical protein
MSLACRVTRRRAAARSVAVAFSLAVASAGASARAATPQQEVEAAETAYANLEYEDANKAAERALRLRGLTHDQLVRAYRVLGLTAGSLGKEQQARDAFVTLLALDPDFQLDSAVSPKVQSPFFEAKGYWRSVAVKPGMEAQTLLRPKEPGTLRVTLRDPSHLVKKMQVAYRWGAMAPMTASTPAPAEVVSIDVPEPPSGVTRFDYYVAATDDRDNVVFEVGNAAVPRTAVVEPEKVTVVAGKREEGSSIFASPWFWIPVGVVVVGAAATGTYFAVHTTEVRTTPADKATLSPSLSCGGTPCI